jgi:HNH endonuclease
MSNLFLVPAGDPRARDNFERTVRQRVPLSDLDRLKPAAVKLARATRGGVSAWGTKPGKGQRHVGTWSAMDRGDRVLFYFDGLFPVSARVLTREHSPAVAKRLWGEDEGQTWEYLYLLDEVRQADIPRLALNARLHYKPGSYPRGFARVKRDLDAEFGSVEQLLEQLSEGGHQLRLAIEAAKAGDEMEAATALDRLASDLSEEQLRREVDAFASSEPPKSRKRLVESLERNRKLVEKLKKLYKGRCQYCGFTFKQSNGYPYCEAAHLKPMARREANIDVKDNLFVLCPNHHKMLDYGGLRIEFDATGTLVGVIGKEAEPLTNKHITQSPN